MQWTDVAAIVGVVGAVTVAYLQVRKVHAQFPSQRVQDGVAIVDAAGDLLDQYRLEVKLLREDTAAMRAELGHDEDRITDLEKRLHFVTNSLDQHRRGVQILITQLKELGVTPGWQPDET